MSGRLKHLSHLRLNPVLVEDNNDTDKAGRYKSPGIYRYKQDIKHCIKRPTNVFVLFQRNDSDNSEKIYYYIYL